MQDNSTRSDTTANMLRPTQQLCCRAFTWSSAIGRTSLRETNSSKCLRPSAIPQSRPQNPRVRERSFSIARSLLAESAKTPQERGRPVDTAHAATVAATIPADAPEAQLDAASAAPSPSEPQRPHRRQRRRRRRGLYYVALSLLLGTTAGTLFRITIAPPALPVPGSDEDAYIQSTIEAKGAALPIVQQLSSDASWTSWDAYAGIPKTPQPENARGISAAKSRITSGPMAGSSGLAFQRIYHNASTGEVVTVVYFGAGLAGWPGIVHGGALATLLDESQGRCAMLHFLGRAAVTANLELKYRRPTLTNNFYVLRTKPIVDEADGAAPKKSDRKLWVQGTLETENGKTCVEAKALFVVPRGYKLQPLAEGF